MKKTAKQDLRQLPVAELQAKIAEAKKTLMTLRLGKAAEGRRQDSQARDLRRSVARMQTIITQKSKQVQA